MANKMLSITLVFAINLILVAAEDCECPDDPTTKEVKEIWEYLLQQDSEDKNFTVIPGELSPLTLCNCIESKRMKRKTEGAKDGNDKEHTHEQRSKEELSREERSPKFFRAWRHANEQRNKCPIGYRRIAFMCVEQINSKITRKTYP